MTDCIHCHLTLWSIGPLANISETQLLHLKNGHQESTLWPHLNTSACHESLATLVQSSNPQRAGCCEVRLRSQRSYDEMGSEALKLVGHLTWKV